MNEESKRSEERQALFEAYNRRTHSFGRIASLITLALLLGLPFVLGGYLGTSPDLKAVGSGFLAIGLVWFVSCIAEWLVYTPMLGAGGGYLAFITGSWWPRCMPSKTPTVTAVSSWIASIGPFIS